MRPRSGSIAAALLALCVGGSALPCRATSLQALNVSDLVRESKDIVRGTVTAVSDGRDDQQRPYTEVEVRVAETIRGAAARTLTFRQFGLQAPASPVEGRRFAGVIAGMPRYAPGEQVLLFLSPTSTLGFRSTIGLGQGHFVLRGGIYSNDAGNAGLFRGVQFGASTLSAAEQSLVATEQGAISAEAFTSLVRSAVAGKWWDGPRPKPSKLGASRIGAGGGQDHD